MKHFLLLAAICLVVSSCAKEPKNPLLGEFNTPFGVPPFDQIQGNHYLPAFNEGIRQQKEEIEAIVAQEEPASFENSVQKLEESGRSTYFSHIFDGSYPAGSYSYYWAEVLDADAFQAFTSKLKPTLVTSRLHL